MLKKVMSILMLFSTSLRMVDFIYLLLFKTTNLPMAVLMSAGIPVLFGLYSVTQIMRKKITLKELSAYYVISTVCIILNIIYVAFYYPLELSLAEGYLVGTLLDIVLNLVLLYYGFKTLRNSYSQLQSQ